MPLPQPTTPASPFGYTGEWTDAATGLKYLRARWYDPATGRFTQVDPFPGVLSLPGTLNPYPYALNNPLLYTDPSGEFVGAALVSGLIGAAFAAAGYVFTHPGQGLECYLSDGDFWRAVGMGAASGLISGFLMGYFAPLSLLATGFGSAMQIGAFLGMTSGGMTYIATSLLFGEPITTQGIVAAMMGGAVFGAIGGALGYGARTARPQPTTRLGAAAGAHNTCDDAILGKLPTRHTSTPAPSDVGDDDVLQMLGRLFKRIEYRDELALIKVGGKRIIYRGADSFFELPSNTIEVIGHTHPPSRPLPSDLDIDLLKALGQASSKIVFPNGDIDIFYFDGSSVPYNYVVYGLKSLFGK